MLAKLIKYASTHGHTLKGRPALTGQLGKGRDCHVIGFSDGEIRFIYRATITGPLLDLIKTGRPTNEEPPPGEG